MKLMINSLLGASFIVASLLGTNAKATDALHASFSTLQQAQNFCADSLIRCVYIYEVSGRYQVAYYKALTTNPAPETPDPRRPDKDIKE